MRALVVIRAFTVLASLATVRPAPTQQTADTNRARQEIARMESERREALLHHDTRALERLLAPEFTQIGNLTGERVITRAEALASNDSGTRRVQSWDASDVNIRMLTNRKSTRLNSSHSQISYAVFCLKKKK